MDQTKANMACAIIVAYNIGTRLLSCFDSIKDQAGEVVLVDNGSDQETLSVLHRLEATDLHVKVFYNETNLGIAAALNIGVKYAIDKGYPYILTLDHDSLATPTMAEKLLSGFQALVEEGIDNVRIMAPIPFDTNINSSLIEVIPGKNDYGVQEVGRVISSGSMIDSRLFKEIGFFNENLFMYYVDDEFCLRCRHNNFKIYICHPALLLHKEGAKEIRKFLWKKVIYRGYDY
ncbi:MAG: glycosyltransferase, partial [Sedimentisphaerales bacterium]|nr:glycosyltransferase [Sedimentisphaerales bacterium]